VNLIGRAFVSVLIFLVMLLNNFSVISGMYSLPSSTYEKPVLLIHDVSPWYIDYIKEIVAVTDKFGYQDSTYLFVIVNHAERAPIERYRDFIDYLHGLEKKGYHIELHGYNHIGKEYDTDYKTASEDLRRAMVTMFMLGFLPHYIFPPRNAYTRDSLSAMHAFGLNVITANNYYGANGEHVKIMAREYTWYLETKQQYEKEKTKFIQDRNYAINHNIPFYISIHPKAVNTLFGMKLLREILTNAVVGKSK